MQRPFYSLANPHAPRRTTMTADEFRQILLSLPDVVEGAHHGHPDFRVGKRVVASLAPDDSWGMLRVPPALQSELVADHPTMFERMAGAWGRQGCTRVWLAKATKRVVTRAAAACRHAAD